MNTQRIIFPSLLLAMLSAGAHAQSSVTLYGSIDEGVSVASNASGSVRALVGPEAVPDFFGLRGSEDLGGQLKAIFGLQQGYSSATGAANVAGNMFSYFSWVGLSGKFGKVTAGRQLDLTSETLMPNSDNGVQRFGFMVHPGNLDNVAILGSSVNNSIRYKSPDFYGFNASVLYGFADSSTQPGRVLGADLAYDQGPLRASFVYSSWRNHTVTVGSSLGYTSFLNQSLNGATGFTLQTQDIFGLSGLYRVSDRLDFHGLLSQVNLGTATSSGRMRTAEVGVNWSTSAANLVEAGGFVSWLTGTRYAQAGLGDQYSFSAATMAYIQAVYQNANGVGHASLPILNSPSSNGNQIVVRIGVHHFF